MERNALSPLLLNLALEHAIRRVQVNQDGLKYMVHIRYWFTDDVNILGESVQMLKKYAEDSVVASKEIGLEVNADRS